MVKFFKENKSMLIFAFFATIFVHLIKFVNYYPTWDSILYGINTDLLGMTELGRWFSGILANLTSSPYDLPWIVGLSAAFFTSLSIVLFLKIFEITSKPLQYISVAAFVTFPSLTATFAYNWSSAYMCALFFVILAVYLCISGKLNRTFTIIYSVILFTLSLGTYQIYYLFAVIVFLFFIFSQLLKGNGIKDYKNAIINFLISLFGGIVLYWIINKIVLSVTKLNLLDYQGISTTRIPHIKDILFETASSVKSFIYFFLGSSSIFKNSPSVLWLYPLINVVIAVLLIICIIKFVLLNKSIKAVNRIIMILIILSIVPVGYAYNFISSGLSYHKLMEFGNYFIYFLLIMFLQTCRIDSMKFKTFIASCLVIISVYNFVNTNVAYHQMSISYEKTYFQNIEIASRIDEFTDDDHKTVAIIGSFKDSGTNISANPAITGARTSIFTWSQYHIVKYSNYYLGRSYVECEQEKVDKISHDSEFLEMTDFPSKGCVKMIDDIIVVRLSEPNEN